MNKVEKIKNKLMLLNDNQLDIVDRLINSWHPKQNNIETNEDIVKSILYLLLKIHLKITQKKNF